MHCRAVVSHGTTPAHPNHQQKKIRSKGRWVCFMVSPATKQTECFREKKREKRQFLAIVLLTLHTGWTQIRQQPTSTRGTGRQTGAALQGWCIQGLIKAHVQHRRHGCRCLESSLCQSLQPPAPPKKGILRLFAGLLLPPNEPKCSSLNSSDTQLVPISKPHGHSNLFCSGTVVSGKGRPTLHLCCWWHHFEILLVLWF